VPSLLAELWGVAEDQGPAFMIRVLLSQVLLSPLGVVDEFHRNKELEMARFAGCQTWCLLHVFQNQKPAISHTWKSDTIRGFGLEADYPVGGFTSTVTLGR